jgi:hypothetical protein
MKRTSQILDCADDINLLSKNINIIKKNTISLSGANKKFGLQIKTKKNKYVGYYGHVSLAEYRTNSQYL